MTITRNFKLYLNAGTASAPYINVNQYDEGEEWVFTLYNEDGSTYTPSSGAIIGIKSDGNAIMNAGSVVGGKVVITETEQMTAASGRAIFELLIDNATHGTANFIVNVERRPSDDAEFSDSDLSMLQEAIDAAEVINEILDAGGDPSEIIAENVNNWLDNHPEATTTVEDGAITAPKINQSLWDKLLVSESASGNPASFDDGADDVPVSSLKVALEPIQTGTGDPSPTNIRPISGHSSVTVERTGKNLYQVTQTSQTIDGVTVTINADGTISLAGTATATIALVLGYFTPKANTRYYVSGSPFATNSCRLQFQEGSTTVVNQYNNESVLVENLNVTQHRIRLYIANGTNVNGVVIKPMIRYASDTDDTFEPYVAPTSYPISLGRDVYGGTVDLTTGVLTLTTGYKNITASDSVSTVGSRGHGWQVYRSSFDNPPLNTGENYSDGVMCDRLKTEIGASSVADDIVFINSTGTLRFNLATVYADKTALFNALSEINVAYPIEPQTIQLTPQEVKTLLGYNNISSSGTVDVIYHADTKLYIDKKIGELS